MAYKDLREFLKLLEGKGLLKRIKAEVDSVLEITEITDRMCKSPGGGKALFFDVKILDVQDAPKPAS